MGEVYFGHRPAVDRIAAEGTVLFVIVKIDGKNMFAVKQPKRSS